MKYNPASLWAAVAGGVLASICLGGAVATATAWDDSTTIVADQVRSQGFACTKPSSVERVAAEFAPNQTVYLLKCEGVTYRVTLVPDQGAAVAQVN